MNKTKQTKHHEYGQTSHGGSLIKISSQSKGEMKVALSPVVHPHTHTPVTELHAVNGPQKFVHGPTYIPFTKQICNKTAVGNFRRQVYLTTIHKRACKGCMLDLAQHIP